MNEFGKISKKLADMAERLQNKNLFREADLIDALNFETFAADQSRLDKILQWLGYKKKPVHYGDADPDIKDEAGATQQEKKHKSLGFDLGGKKVFTVSEFDSVVESVGEAQLIEALKNKKLKESVDSLRRISGSSLIDTARAVLKTNNLIE